MEDGEASESISDIWDPGYHGRKVSTAQRCTEIIQIGRKEKTASALGIAWFCIWYVNNYLIRHCIFVRLKKLLAIFGKKTQHQNVNPTHMHVCVGCL